MRKSEREHARERKRRECASERAGAIANARSEQASSGREARVGAQGCGAGAEGNGVGGRRGSKVSICSQDLEVHEQPDRQPCVYRQLASVRL